MTSRNEYGAPRIVLDTKPLIRLFSKEEGWEDVQSLLLCVENGEAEAAVSVVTLTEVYYKYLQEGRKGLARERVWDIRHAKNVDTLAIGGESALLAGKFKGKYGVPIADAFIAASAYLEDAIVISDDQHFRKIDDIEVLSEADILSNWADHGT